MTKFLTLVQGELPLGVAVNLHEYLEIHQTDEGFQAIHPCEPTTIPPGPQKVELLARRLELGQELFNEQDPRVRSTKFAADLVLFGGRDDEDDDTD